MNGEQVRLPDNLYIPPDALEVFLESFSGPLDLLLYLIRRKNIAVCDIPIAAITEQYMAYIMLMRRVQLDLAGEYLVMAALLTEMKSQALLPAPRTTEETEEDTRTNLVRRLQEYARFQSAAKQLDRLPRLERDVHQALAAATRTSAARTYHPVTAAELLTAYREVLRRMHRRMQYRVDKEPLSVTDRMHTLSQRIEKGTVVPFFELFLPHEGRRGIIVTFLALLELIKSALFDMTYTERGVLLIKKR